MGKFLFIGCTQKMTEYAQYYIKATGRTDVEAVCFPASDAAGALEYVKASEAQIIIARGIVAAELKSNTGRSVIEIVITAQEMGLLIKQAKEMMRKKTPAIGIVGISRMFCDMRDFDQIFDIKLIKGFVNIRTELEAAVERTIAEGAELIIGGEIVCNCAKKRGMPYLHQPDGSDSIEQAFRIADSVAWAADMEKKNAVELKALLDFSSNGIIKIDKQGLVVSLNNRVLALLEKTRDEVEGRSITELIPEVEEQQVCNDVLRNGQEVFFTFWHTTGSALAVNVVPLMFDSGIEGAILSFHVINKLKQMEAEARRDLYQKNSDFDWLPTLFSENASFLQSAKNLAQYDECVLLSGSHPAEREMIARYMHNVSLRREAPFVYFTGDTYSLTAQSGDSEKNPLPVDAGTIFIDEVETLSRQAQYQLFRTLSDGLLARYISGAHNVQIIIGTQADLAEAVRKGTVREDLYYLVSALTLDIPSLENCPNEIRNWLNHYMQQYSDMYSAYVHITKAAKSAILSHPWRGGIAELRSFCCKAVIHTPKNVLDESTALRFLRKANPYQPVETSRKSAGLNANPEVTRLKFLLEKYDGNRSMIADEMHISVTTLWRRLKKYGLMQ